MKDKDLLEKLWRLQCLMAEIESKAGDVAKHLGFKGMHQTVYDYIKAVEKEPKHHFFAASAFNWCASTPDRNLRDVVRIMEKYGHTYNLYLVPVPHDTPYDINMFQPQVEGTQWLGCFEVKKQD